MIRFGSVRLLVNLKRTASVDKRNKTRLTRVQKIIVQKKKKKKDNGIANKASKYRQPFKLCYEERSGKSGDNWQQLRVKKGMPFNTKSYYSMCVLTGIIPQGVTNRLQRREKRELESSI